MKIQKRALLLCTEGKAMGRKTTQVNLTSPENQILNKYRGRIKKYKIRELQIQEKMLLLFADREGGKRKTIEANLAT